MSFESTLASTSTCHVNGFQHKSTPECNRKACLNAIQAPPSPPSIVIANKGLGVHLAKVSYLHDELVLACKFASSFKGGCFASIKTEKKRREAESSRGSRASSRQRASQT